MKKLTAVFELVDIMSGKFDAIANKGDAIVDNWENAGNAIDQCFDRAVSASGEAAQAVDNYSQAISEAEVQTEDIAEQVSSSVDALDSQADAMARCSQAADELSEATENAGDEAENAGKKGEDAIKELQSAMASAGIMKAVQEVTEALLDASEASARVETAFAKLQTIAGADAMGTLTGQIKELSADTHIAQDVLADVAYNAISAGSSVEDAVGTAGAAAKLAKAGFTETSSALSVLSTAMNSYGDSAGTAMDISDSLIMVQNLGVTTVAELAASMGKSISTASAYNVSLGNLESAYVSVTKAGINTAEGTTYISGMLSELGKEGSTVANILQEQTGQSFGQLMSSGYTLADVLDIIYEAAGRDAEAMMNLWSSQTAGVASAAIINQGLEQFNANLEAIEGSAGATEKAYSTMASTTENAQEKMNNSAENLKIAIGDSLNPALEKLYNLGAGAFQWAADFAEQNPVVVKAITAVAVCIGVVAVAIGGFTFVTQVAIPAIKSFGMALNTALGPIGWVTIAIAGVVAAGTALGAMFSDAEDEIDEMTTATQKQLDEQERLRKEYEKSCEIYGETSEKARALKYDLDAANEAIEAQSFSVKDLYAEIDALHSSTSTLMDDYNAVDEGQAAQSERTSVLVAKLKSLARASEQTAGSQEQMKTIIGELNTPCYLTLDLLAWERYLKQGLPK